MRLFSGAPFAAINIWTGFQIGISRTVTTMQPMTAAVLHITSGVADCGLVDMNVVSIPEDGRSMNKALRIANVDQPGDNGRVI